jgi:hypothetical protein
LNVKPAVGFTLPSAGVTPAPDNRKGCGTSSLLGSWVGEISQRGFELIKVEVDSATSVTILPVAEKVAAVGS